MIKGQTKTEAQYRAIPVDSSSTLKDFSFDRRKYFKKYILGEKVKDEESKAIVTGSLVDTLLFEKDQFDNRFYLSSCANPPTGNMLAFVNALIERQSLHPESSFEEIANLAYKDSGFKWSLERVLTNFNGSDSEIYYRELRLVEEKNLTVVCAEDVANAEKIVQEMKTNEFTASIVNQETDGRYDVINQLKVDKFEVGGIPFKAMLDKVIIDHVDKKIHIYDLKCVWSVENFYYEYYLKRRAYIQAYLYREAARWLKEEMKLDYYEIQYMKFIVSDSINYYNPLIYITTSRDMASAYYGFELRGREYPGVQELITDLKWAKKNNIWNISRKNHSNEGVVLLT
jgi:hypothetical protein